MGSSITTPPNPAIGGSGFLCPMNSIGVSQMYFTSALCYYPDSMTSVQKTGPFFVTVKTNLDTTTNVNPLPPLSALVYSGFEFDWTHNSC
ncbi:hypothetical protein SK128_001714 [Halocaridina rubra]|uniref:Uncharacterized protein n=1 Tax=Halocaridina rubra TaxID=373956 RepID=A0AAN8WEX8_HALRR